MTASAIPGFLDALVPLLKAAPALAGWIVVDGPALENTSRPDVLAVGISTEDLSVETEKTDVGLGPRRERADVTCMALSWTGDAALAPRRAQAFAAMSAVEDVLRADPTVTGTVTRARVMGAVYTPGRDAKGCGASVEFRIRVDAFRP